MRPEGFDYAKLMQRALRGLLREVLAETAERGLPGDHHFFISFDVTHPGVDVPDWLRAEHPRELAIVLQHEFDDLAVTGDRFSVRLSFKNRQAALAVPFEAVTTFADPSENFGLRFDQAESGRAAEEGAEEDASESSERPPQGDAEVVSLDSFRKR
jgi:hypothetical protein